jgi:hypothetical protein
MCLQRSRCLTASVALDISRLRKRTTAMLRHAMWMGLRHSAFHGKYSGSIELDVKPDMTRQNRRLTERAVTAQQNMRKTMRHVLFTHDSDFVLYCIKTSAILPHAPYSGKAPNRRDDHPSIQIQTNTNSRSMIWYAYAVHHGLGQD